MEIDLLFPITHAVENSYVTLQSALISAVIPYLQFRVRGFNQP